MTMGTGTPAVSECMPEAVSPPLLSITVVPSMMTRAASPFGYRKCERVVLGELGVQHASPANREVIRGTPARR